MAPRLGGVRTNPLSRLKGAWVKRLSEGSFTLWAEVFAECDNDDDGFVDRRETLVLLSRLGVGIPSEASLKMLIERADLDENGQLDFDEFCELVGALEPEAFTPGWISETPSGATRQWLSERRSVVLWRDIFDSLDMMPRNGFLESGELSKAFKRAGVPVEREQLYRLLKKYDTNGDGRLSFNEYCRMTTDLISSAVQYERAAASASRSLRSYEEAAALAGKANRYAEAVAEKARTERRADTGAEAGGLEELEKRIGDAFVSTTFTEAEDVLQAQDLLFQRFKAKYDKSCHTADTCVELNDFLTPERVQLLDAIKQGDVDGIRSLINIDWNFVYPPAIVSSNSIGERERERELEAWCRSPLCLLVRPDEGNFRPKMPGLADSERQELIEDVLASGCADPNFPPIYWGGPAVHACFEGDVAALDALRQAGCNLQQKVEWLLQDAPLFSLVHAAAYNGQKEVLVYLRQYMPPSFFRECDAEGSNALHTLLESSRDLSTARFLLEMGVDGFAINRLGRSPLSMAVEVLPELALELLSSKSRFEYRWWGNDLYWFSFTGIVLPLAARSLDSSVVRGATGGKDATGGTGGTGDRVFPLTFRDISGRPATLEDLVLRHERKELLDTPVMLDIIERKWRCFASTAYRTRILSFGAMLTSVFIISAGEVGTPLFYAAAASTFATWGVFLKEQSDRLATRRQAAIRYETPLSLSDLSFFDALTIYNLALVPIVAAYRLVEAEALGDVPGGLLLLMGQYNDLLASLAGTLQVSLALSLLNYVSIFRALGPLLITVVQLVADALRFSAILGVVVLGYANGFYSLVHFGVTDEYLSSLPFGDYSYTHILTAMGLWLAGQPEVEIFEGLSPGVQLGGSVNTRRRRPFHRYIPSYPPPCGRPHLVL